MDKLVFKDCEENESPTCPDGSNQRSLYKVLSQGKPGT